MKVMRGIPSFVCYVSMIMVADCVLLSKDTEDHINGCIEMFLQTPKCPFFDAIVNPPRIGPSDEASIEAFFLPKILIWCPMTRWQLNLECPSHKKALKPSYFMNSNQVWRQPRLIYDLSGNVVLISRTYICQTQFRCRFRSTDDIIIQQIPAYVNIPFVLSYRSGVSEELMNYLYCQIGTGVTFSEISNMISELNSAEYLIQMKQYLLRNIHQIEMNAYDTLEYPDWCQQLFSAPSRDMLQSVFLKDFYTLKFCFEKEMHGLSATSISTDHTFKICKNIGIIDTDNNWIKQYPNLFLVLNQKGQVISWALTKSTSFEEVRSVFSNIRERLLEQSVCLTSAYIDNCCAWKSKLHSEFGPGLKVKLDLFHAVQRFTSTVPKRGVTSLRYDMFQDFTLIFRENDDQGKTRLKTTPDQSTILKNLENFKTKWTSVLLTHGEGPLKALKNLEQHISAGCLSEIEQGRGTERNENLHKILNSSVLSHARTLGPELAFAVLTILFFTMNKQISGNRFHSRNFLKLKYLKKNPVQCPESFGFICKDKNILSNHRSEVVHITDSHFEEGADNICEGIISHSESLYNVLKNIETHCFSRNIDVSRLPLIYNKQHLCFLNSVFNNGGSEINASECSARLGRRLSSFNLRRVSISGDGNCAFRSIAQQVILMSSRSDERELLSHFLDLGLEGDENVISSRLRYLFVKELQEKSEEYRLKYTYDMSAASFEKEIQLFSSEGVFSGQVGDIVMKALSEILCCSIIIISSLDAIEVIPLFPEKIISNYSLFVAYDHSGPGHYDGTTPVSVTGGNSSELLQESDSRTDSSAQFCRCGSNSSKTDNGFIACCDENKSGYKTRCKCYRSKVGCSSCNCINCANTYNEESSSKCIPHKLHNCIQCKSEKTVKSRKRVKTSHEKKTTKTFLKDLEEDITEGGWSMMETCCLEAILAYLKSCGDEIHCPTIQSIFNKTAEKTSFQRYKLNKKSIKQIEGKMKSRTEAYDTSLKHIATQIQLQKTQ